MLTTARVVKWLLLKSLKLLLPSVYLETIWKKFKLFRQILSSKVKHSKQSSNNICSVFSKCQFSYLNPEKNWTKIHINPLMPRPQVKPFLKITSFSLDSKLSISCIIHQQLHQTVPAVPAPRFKLWWFSEKLPPVTVW